MSIAEWIAMGTALLSIAGAYWRVVIQGNQDKAQASQDKAALERFLRDHIEERLSKFMPRELIDSQLRALDSRISELRAAQDEARDVSLRMHSENVSRADKAQEEIRRFIERGFDSIRGQEHRQQR